jgi:hypothetical protein
MDNIAILCLLDPVRKNAPIGRESRTMTYTIVKNHSREYGGVA